MKSYEYRRIFVDRNSIREDVITFTEDRLIGKRETIGHISHEVWHR